MINCIAIDDEPLALAQISGYIDKTPFLKLHSACRSALEAIEIISTQNIELLFVDINMPDLNGLDFVRSLSVKPLIIFTTAYSEYALEGFKVDAFDYLLKPIDYGTFLCAAEKANRQIMLIAKSKQSDSDNVLFVKSGYKSVRIELDNISFIESQNEYVKIYLENEPPVITLGTLKSYEEKLSAEHFMQVHRSFIVNLNKISVIDRKTIIIDKNKIPIGERYEDNIRNYLSNRSF